MEPTIQKSYRLKPETLTKIRELQRHFHGLLPPRVIALAVDRLHEETFRTSGQGEAGRRLAPKRDGR